MKLLPVVIVVADLARFPSFAEWQEVDALPTRCRGKGSYLQADVWNARCCWLDSVWVVQGPRRGGWQQSSSRGDDAWLCEGERESRTGRTSTAKAITILASAKVAMMWY